MHDELTRRSWGPLARIERAGDRIERIEVPGATVVCTPVTDPLLGDAHVIVDGDREITRISAIDWSRPTEIPAIAAPGALPAGVGGLIMNVLAELAQRAGIPALRYAGPYPTSALYKTLARSFRTTGSEADFTADLLGRMARLARDPIPIDFTPAPHERRSIYARTTTSETVEVIDGREQYHFQIESRTAGHLELRDGIERVVIDGITYERGGSPARLVDHQFVVAAELWFGDRFYARVANFWPDGRIDGELRAIPPCTSDVIGKPFPPPLVGALAELVGEAVPPLLADDARRWLATRTIVWADLGARAARSRDNTIEVHAAIWQHVAPHGLGRVALALAEAIAPVVTTSLVTELARR